MPGSSRWTSRSSLACGRSSRAANALEREFIYDEIKRAQRQNARIGVAPVDIALWDLAGRLLDQPIYRLLGGWKKSVPCYASTYHGDENGGLDTPQAFADFAVQCRDMGYPAFKIHGWGAGSGEPRGRQRAGRAGARSETRWT